MCIIISKEKNKRLPTKEELTNSFNYNSDGAGFMYVNKGQVIIDKGYMNLKDFLNRYDQLCTQFDNFKNKALIIHCRIGTSAGNIAENTHPYIITNKEKKLHKTYIKSDVGIAHNGIIYDYTPKSKNATINDTQNFIMKYLFPIYNNFKDFYKIDTFRNGMAKITNSKFVFLNTNEKIYYVGDFVTDNGLKFSNTTYQTPKYTYNYSKYFDDYYDKYYDDYDLQELPKTKSNIIDVDFEKEYTDTEYGKEEFIYYDYNENLIYLPKDYYLQIPEIDFSDFVYNIDNYDLIYSLDTMELFELNENNTLIKLYDDVIVYDSIGDVI